MLKFYKKYELGIKFLLVAIAIFIGGWKIFSARDSENKNFQLFTGVVWLIITLFLLFDGIIGLIQKRKISKKN